MIVGVILSAFIFSAYLIWAFWKCGVTPTLSETHYHLPKWQFPCAMTSMAVLALPYWLEYNEDWQFLAFISCVGIMLLGAAPLFKTQDRKIHISAVCVAGVSALIWCLIMNWIVTCLLAVLACGLILNYKKYWALIMEITMFVCVYFILLFL